MLFCPKHWAMVPRMQQQEVWRTYRPGQEQDKRPSPAYCRAAYEACSAVLTKLRCTDTKLWEEAKQYLVLAAKLEGLSS